MRWATRRTIPTAWKPSGISNRLLIETEDRFIFQPCVSPIWDTAICAFALGEAGITDDPRMTQRGRLADQ